MVVDFVAAEHSELIVAASPSVLPRIPRPSVALSGVTWYCRSKENDALTSGSRKSRTHKLVRHLLMRLALSVEAIDELQDSELVGGGASIARLRVGQ